MPNVLESTTEVAVNSNPEVRKDIFRDRLTKTQLHRGTFYKFLLQAGIPFTPMQSISLPTKLDVDRLLKKHVRKYTTPTYKDLYNLNKLSVVCRLDGVLIGDKEVYVEIRYKDYHEMSNGERNRLLATLSSVNLITFFHEDFAKVGLKLEEEQKYIRTLSKTVLKNWADLLFKKIRGPRKRIGKIEIPYSLLDVRANIDENSLDDGDVVCKLREQNSKLRKELLIRNLANSGKLSPDHDPILERVVEENPDALSWIGRTLNDVSSQLLSIDLRKKKDRQFFLEDSGKINATNKDNLSNYIGALLPNIWRSTVNYLGDGVMEVSDATTLHKFYLQVVTTTSDDPKSITFPIRLKGKLSNQLVFTLIVHYAKINQNSPKKITSVVFLPGLSDRKSQISKSQRVSLFQREVKGKKGSLEWWV